MDYDFLDKSSNYQQMNGARQGVGFKQKDRALSGWPAPRKVGDVKEQNPLPSATHQRAETSDICPDLGRSAQKQISSYTSDVFISQGKGSAQTLAV